MNNDDIKRCPFCRGNAEVTEIEVSDQLRYAVFCGACGSEGPVGKLSKEAVLRWNRRHEV